MKITSLLTLLIAEVLCVSWTDRAIGDTFGTGANIFDIEFVTIGGPGNEADAAGEPNPAGSVDYTYRIGKFEVSEQMVAKANAEGGLEIPVANRGADKPATGISWNQAARFVNWLNDTSGSAAAYKFAFQPGEVGYDANDDIELWTIGDAGYDPNNLYRNRLARYFLPSIDEWYKAAYYDPSSGIYYDYPTGSNSVPDGIDFTGDPNFDAVFFDGGNNGQPRDIFDAGVLSPYGTAAQGGNVWEWQETDFDLVNDSSSSPRGFRGGNLVADASTLSSVALFNNHPASRDGGGGFRVASVPEPRSMLLLGLAVMQGLPRRRRCVR
jgi:formylglycine-generating enzyme required for sulfatase activity